MPIFDHRYLDAQKEPHPGALQNLGAILQVEVDIPPALQKLLTAKKQPVPTSAKGMALIDTGATKSCAEQSVLSSLGISPIGVVKIGTAQGTTQCALFPARLIFPTLRLRVNFSAMVGVNLQGQLVQGLPLIALVGRDVLSRCLFIYCGSNGYYTLSF